MYQERNHITQWSHSIGFLYYSKRTANYIIVENFDPCTLIIIIIMMYEFMLFGNQFIPGRKLVATITQEQVTSILVCNLVTNTKHLLI